jgi:hypothetical protein
VRDALDGVSLFDLRPPKMKGVQIYRILAVDASRPLVAYIRACLELGLKG